MNFNKNRCLDFAYLYVRTIRFLTQRNIRYISKNKENIH